MYVLAISGSPRKGGNTEQMLQQVLEPLRAAGWESKLYNLGGRAVHGCTACMKCWENQNQACIIGKDCINELIAEMARADAIVIGTPTYFADVSTEVKALIDRAGMVGLANGGLYAGKIGAAVVAVRRGGATHAFDSINHLFLISRMLVPGSTYWNLGVGLNREDVLADAEGMANMKNLGENIAWLGMAIAPHKESFPNVESVVVEG